MVAVVLVSLLASAGALKCVHGSGGNGGGGDPSPALAGDVRDFKVEIPLFSAGSPWRAKAGGAVTLPESEEQLLALYRVLLGGNQYLSIPDGGMSEPFPFPYVNCDEYGVAIYRAGDDLGEVALTDFLGEEGGATSKFPGADSGAVNVLQPEGTVCAAGPKGEDADGHLVLLHVSSNVAYDFWQATVATDGSGQSLGGGVCGERVSAAGAVEKFDLAGSGVNENGMFSARAHGVPLLAGLILPEDVKKGVIEHALALAIPGPRNLNSAEPWEPLASDYFYPASTTETDFYSSDPNALASGQRIRLKGSLVDDEGEVIDESDLAPITVLFLAALRTHGAYVVDNAGGFTFYAEDPQSARLELSDAQVNELMGRPAGTAFSGGESRWLALITALNNELEMIPLAYGPSDWDDAESATVEQFNFEVVESVTPPADW